MKFLICLLLLCGYVLSYYGDILIKLNGGNKIYYHLKIHNRIKVNVKNVNIDYFGIKECNAFDVMKINEIECLVFSYDCSNGYTNCSYHTNCPIEYPRFSYDCRATYENLDDDLLELAVSYNMTNISKNKLKNIYGKDYYLSNSVRVMCTVYRNDCPWSYKYGNGREYFISTILTITKKPFITHLFIPFVFGAMAVCEGLYSILGIDILSFFYY